MSSSLNSLAATLFEDFVRPCFKNKISDHKANNMIKCVVVIVGAICVGIVFIVDKLGTVLQLSISFGSISQGTMLGLFILGMFYPRANAKGALAGSICSLLLVGWIVFGAQMEYAAGRMKNQVLPTSVEGCDFNTTIFNAPIGFNSTFLAATEREIPEDKPLAIYRISFLYYTFFAVVIVLMVGVIVSHLTEEPSPEKTRPELFTPLVKKYALRKKISSAYYFKEVAEKELLNVNPQKCIS